MLNTSALAFLPLVYLYSGLPNSRNKENVCRNSGDVQFLLHGLAFKNYVALL